MTVTLDEAKSDLRSTIDDATRLSLIVDNMRMFMQWTGGEDRSFVKMDLMRYENYLQQARALIPRIEKRIADLTPPEKKG